MSRGVCWFFVCSFVLVALAGCGRGLFETAEREPWRAEAEVACLKSGAVRESPDLVRINPISGPGVCGAEFPLKVAAFGEGNSGLGYTDDLRPPGGIGNGPRWPVGQSRPSYSESAVRQPGGYAASQAPVSLNAPGVETDSEDEAASDGGSSQAPLTVPSHQPPLPRLGPAQGSPVNSFGAVAVKPAATLACPIVSVLDRWIMESIQPAAMRWFGARVVEIKQISAYACRGRNGDHSSKISEHAFGNALDIAAFVLADGRKIVVETGWNGLPEEQAFLRDVQRAACQQFTTVLAPGSNAAHYNHIHVDLRKRNGRDICKPQAMAGAVAAASRTPFAPRQIQEFTGSIGKNRDSKTMHHASEDDDN